MKTLKIITYVLAIIAGFFIGSTCQAQSFYPARPTPGSNYQGTHSKTIGQKLRNKVKYAKKRHHNAYFSEKERRRDMKRRGFKI